MKNSITQKVNDYKRILTMIPGFDKRNPDPAKNYGIHGMEIRFDLLKNNKAISFVIFSNMYLPHLYKEWENRGDMKVISFQPMGADVGYHSPEPMYNDQKSYDCHLLKGKCYYDGSSLRAEEWCKIWLEEGNDKIWKMMEKEYERQFGQH